MKWNRKSLLAAVRQHGFSEDPKDATLDAVKTFLDGKGLNLGDDVDLAEVWKKTVTISVSADAGEDVQVQDQSTASADEMPEEDPEAEPKAAPKSAARGAENRRKYLQATAGIHAPAVHTDMESKRYERAIREGKAFGNARPVWTSADQAHGFGEWVKSVVAQGKTHSLYDNALGGVLVPEEYRAELIDLKSEYGAARKVVGVQTLTRDVEAVPRQTSDVVVARTVENASLTAQAKPTFDLVKLTAEELGGLLALPNALLAQSAIALGNVAGLSFAQGFATYEDNAYFKSADNWAGLSTKLGSTNTHDAALSTGWGDYTVSKLQTWIGKLPSRAWKAGNIAIVCSRNFDYTVFRSVAKSAGGTQPQDILGRVSDASYDGIPVVYTDAMPTTYTGDQISAYVGSFSGGTKFGEVTGSGGIDTSEHFYFGSNQTAFRSLERIAINCHDVQDDANSMVIALKD